jgi:hypothetical protein
VVQLRYRNYQTFGGVTLPMTIETGAATTKGADRMVIQRVSINPPLDDRRFTRPHVPGSNVVTIAPPPQRPSPLPQPPARPQAGTPPSADLPTAPATPAAPAAPAAAEPR